MSIFDWNQIEQPVRVIAEIGVNHDGSLERALELVGHAKSAGADAIKLQIFSSRNLVNGAGELASYQQDRCDDTDSAGLLRRLELTDDQYRIVVQAARSANLAVLATPFSPADVARVRWLGLDAVKIASPDLVNVPLLSAAEELGLPMIVSTGAATLEEIARAVEWMRARDVQLLLMHCISAYPTPVEQANLAWMVDLERRFNVPVGYSDHTSDLLAGALAAAAGAVAIEKHLTWDRAAPGPDHALSADPNELAEYVQFVRRAGRMRGSGSRHVLAVEEDVRRVSRQSLVAARPIPPGKMIAADDLTVMRPGTGISASEYEAIVGLRTRRGIAAGQMLTWDMITHAEAA